MNLGQHLCHLVCMTSSEIEVDAFSAFIGELYEPGLFELNNFLFSSETISENPDTP